MGMCGRLCAHLVRRSLRDTDSAEDRRLKEVFVPFFVALAVYHAIVIPLLIVITVGIVLQDWRSSATRWGNRSWALAVLVLDCLLVVGDSGWLSQAVIGAVLMWLVIERAECVMRFGLYEASTWGEGRSVIEVCDCVAPPCSDDSGALTDFSKGQWGR
eukprot:gene32450-18612_t